MGDALRAAERVCADRVVRLTPIRRRVLEIVWSSHDPIGAYDIIAKLPRGDRPAAPMTVYRALDFLVEQGLVHRLDSLNAFIGCDRATERHAGQLLVCGRCGKVTEIDDPRVQRAVDAAAAEHGFRCDAALEVKGLCARCSGAA
ncbi:MAG: Fur family transcriptional regulator [Pseudomonadota bacterium]